MFKEPCALTVFFGPLSIDLTLTVAMVTTMATKIG